VVDQLDPVSVLIALFTVALGPALAAVLGPYAVIIIAATTGASWALGRRDTTTRLTAFFFFARIMFTALLITVPIMGVIKGVGLPFDARWLLAPIAILIGAVGDDWSTIGRWALTRIGRFIDFWIELRARSNAGDPK
jgi:hypothetical protein